MSKWTERNRKENHIEITVKGKFPEKMEKEMKLDIRKMIRKWNHLLDKGLSADLVIISDQLDSFREG